MKIRPVGAELFHADGRTYEQKDKWTEGQMKANVKNTMAVFRNFAIASKYGPS